MSDSMEAAGTKILEGIRDVNLDPTEVDKIWDLEPKELTPAKRAVIIETLRRNRALFVALKEKKAAKKRTPKKAVPEGGVDYGDLGLDDLEL